MSGQTCENCGKTNPEHESYCFACGHILPHGLRALSTHLIEPGKPLKPQIRWGTAYFGTSSVLRFHIRHSDEVFETRFEHECVLGRAVGDSVPNVDLTPYGAVDLGVSRQHAKLSRQSATIMVQDLDSSNGTFLNGDRLLPFQPRVLRNEDELGLGQMVMRVSFLAGPPRR